MPKTDLIPAHRQVTHTPDGIRFSVAEAQNALARSDDGLPAQPGDLALIVAYEQQCQRDADRLLRDELEQERAEWLASQCRYCGPEGSTGDDCGSCDGPADNN